MCTKPALWAAEWQPVLPISTTGPQANLLVSSSCKHSSSSWRDADPSIYAVRLKAPQDAGKPRSLHKSCKRVCSNTQLQADRGLDAFAAFRCRLKVHALTNCCLFICRSVSLSDPYGSRRPGQQQWLLRRFGQLHGRLFVAVQPVRSGDWHQMPPAASSHHRQRAVLPMHTAVISLGRNHPADCIIPRHGQHCGGLHCLHHHQHDAVITLAGSYLLLAAVTSRSYHVNCAVCA